MSWPSLIPLYSHPDAWHLHKVTYREALRIKPEDGFLHSNLPLYDIARMLDRSTEPGATIFTNTPIPDAYTTRTVLVGYVDELLLQDAFNLRKPILAICYGVQALNVWRNGSLIQDLEVAGDTHVNHRPGREVIEAHPVHIAPGSRLAAMATDAGEIQVNSSHHQALRVPGDNLRVAAVCPADGVIEGVELDSPEHFVVGVQWHPERTYTNSAFSRAIFSAFVRAAAVWQPRPAELRACAA